VLLFYEGMASSTFAWLLYANKRLIGGPLLVPPESFGAF
jgi:hypothetical protein